MVRPCSGLGDAGGNGEKQAPRLPFRLRALTKRCGDRTVVRRVDLACVRRFSVCGFVGPKGEAKSTSAKKVAVQYATLIGLLPASASRGRLGPSLSG